MALKPNTSVLSTSFISRRVNVSTFLIIEDDYYGEQPYIYIKIYPDHLIITDTGCNTPRDKDKSLVGLRQYLETFSVADNNNQCLNPNGRLKYIIICSHCHYDHILGIPQFLSANPFIVASNSDRNFLLKDLPKHSLCKYIDVPTPKYNISHWAHHMSFFSLPKSSFRVQFFQTSGHTPDSLTWYDLDEHQLYVGDIFYERKRRIPIPELPEKSGQVPGLPATQAAIIFPEEGGDWIQYISSLELLLSFVLHQNRELERRNMVSHGTLKRVKVSCGHLTYNADAEHMILEVRSLFERIIAGKVPVISSGKKRRVIHDYWLESESSKYSVIAPRHLAEEAYKYFHPV